MKEKDVASGIGQEAVSDLVSGKQEETEESQAWLEGLIFMKHVVLYGICWIFINRGSLSLILFCKFFSSFIEI